MHPNRPKGGRNSIAPVVSPCTLVGQPRGMRCYSWHVPAFETLKQRSFHGEWALPTLAGRRLHPGRYTGVVHGPESGHAGPASARTCTVCVGRRRCHGHGQRDLGNALRRDAGVPPAAANCFRRHDDLRLVAVAGRIVRSRALATAIPDGPAAASCRQCAADGYCHQCHALHRHGQPANASCDHVFSVAVRAVGRHRDRRVGAGAADRHAHAGTRTLALHTTAGGQRGHGIIWRRW
jgi:hypothetical protein